MVSVLLTVGILFLAAGFVLFFVSFVKKKPPGTQQAMVRHSDFNMGKNQGLQRMDNELLSVVSIDNELNQMANANLQLRDKVEEVGGYYDPSRGRFTSWWQAGKAQGRVELLKIVNLEQAKLIEQAAQLEQAAATSQKARAEFFFFIKQNEAGLKELEAKAYLLDIAARKEMTPQGLNEVSVYKAKAEIDKKALQDSTEINLAAAERYKMRQDVELNRLRDDLEKALIKLDEIENNSQTSERTKIELITSKESQIENLKFRIKQRENRLVEDEA